MALRQWPVVKRCARFLRRHDWIRRGLIFLLIAAFYMCIVYPTYIAYSQESEEKEAYLERNPYTINSDKLQEVGNNDTALSDLLRRNDPSVSISSDYIDIRLVAVNADFANRALRVRTFFAPVGAFAVDNRRVTVDDQQFSVMAMLPGYYDSIGTTQPSVLAQPVTVLIDAQRYRFTANQTMGSQEFQVPFVNGNQRDYPFDKYPTSIGLTAFVEPAANSTAAGGPRTYVPIRVSFVGSVQSVHFRVLEQHDSIISTSIYLRTRRTDTTIVFSMFICALMWMITIALGSLWMQLVVRGREIQPPFMALGVTLLFALPGLRASQPSVPTVGVASDMLGFIWNIILVATFTSSIVLSYVFRWAGPEKKKKADDAPAPLLPTAGKMELAPISVAAAAYPTTHPSTVDSSLHNETMVMPSAPAESGPFYRV